MGLVSGNKEFREEVGGQQVVLGRGESVSVIPSRNWRTPKVVHLFRDRGEERGPSSTGRLGQDQRL